MENEMYSFEHISEYSNVLVFMLLKQLSLPLIFCYRFSIFFFRSIFL